MNRLKKARKIRARLSTGCSGREGFPPTRPLAAMLCRDPALLEHAWETMKKLDYLVLEISFLELFSRV